MKIDKVIAAKHEAERFLKKVRALEGVAQMTPHALYHGCEETAAVRRSSMDLSKALSSLRKRE